MKDLINLDYNGAVRLLVEYLYLIGFSLVSFWLFLIGFIVFQNKKNNPKRSYNNIVKLSFQNSLIWLMIIFSGYFGFFLATNGKYLFIWDKFPLDNTNTYYLLLPQIFLYFLLVGVYITNNASFKKQLI